MKGWTWNVIFAIRLWLSRHTPWYDGIFSEQQIRWNSSCFQVIEVALAKQVAATDNMQTNEAQTTTTTNRRALSFLNAQPSVQWQSHNDSRLWEREWKANYSILSPYPLIILANVLHKLAYMLNYFYICSKVISGRDYVHEEENNCWKD